VLRQIYSIYIYGMDNTKLTSKVGYLGNLRTEMVHLASESRVCTDAPPDNHGLGQAFSPTDLVATALASCMMTVMGIRARDMGLNMEGSLAYVRKEMYANPRRIGEIHIVLEIRGIDDERSRKVLRQIGLSCPVAKSLHPELQQVIDFQFV
jgi:uncharacterized OsmC-like protein